MNLQQFLLDRDTSIYKLAKDGVMARQTFYDWINGTHEPNKYTKNRFIKYFSLSEKEFDTMYKKSIK